MQQQQIILSFFKVKICNLLLKTVTANLLFHLVTSQAFDKKHLHLKVSACGSWLDGVRCEGTEASIADCQHSEWELSTCYSASGLVSVKCSDEDHGNQ